jgi:hypothetical protein
MIRDVIRLHCQATDRNQLHSRMDAIFASFATEPAHRSLYRMSG